MRLWEQTPFCQQPVITSPALSDSTTVGKVIDQRHLFHPSWGTLVCGVAIEGLCKLIMDQLICSYEMIKSIYCGQNPGPY